MTVYYLFAFDEKTHLISYYAGIQPPRKYRSKTGVYKIVSRFVEAHTVPEKNVDSILDSLNKFSSTYGVWDKKTPIEMFPKDEEVEQCFGCNLYFTEKEKAVAHDFVKEAIAHSSIGVFTASRLHELGRFEFAQDVVGFRVCKKCGHDFCGSCMRTKMYCKDCRIKGRR
jgi:hypothetical protein